MSIEDLDKEILEGFLRLDVNQYVRDLIKDAIISYKNDHSQSNKKFEFNCYELEMDFLNMEATLDDVLEGTGIKHAKYPMNYFLKTIGVEA